MKSKILKGLTEMNRTWVLRGNVWYYYNVATGVILAKVFKRAFSDIYELKILLDLDVKDGPYLREGREILFIDADSAKDYCK